MYCKIEKLGHQFLVFRDDLYPFLGGGNKGRKIKYIERHIIKNNANAVVTTGGIESNHNRATAILAAQNNWKCTLVIHGDKSKFYQSKGNGSLIKYTGAKLLFVNPNEISQAMDDAIEEYKTQGFNPYYIYGGGHTMEGGLAYIDAVNSLKLSLEKMNENIEYIFLASGTGSTQAGILAGLDKEKMNVEVIGISVGRSRERAENVVEKFYKSLCSYYYIDYSDRNVHVLDDYLCGGYGKYDTNIKTTSLNSLSKYGFTLDRTYTAKAFYGMQDYVKRNAIRGKVLFWHTGGIFNFLAEN